MIRSIGPLFQGLDNNVFHVSIVISCKNLEHEMHVWNQFTIEFELDINLRKYHLIH